MRANMSLPDQNRKENPLPELLSPAGSPEAFRAAVAAGADAVYLGGKRFGARKSAANFTDAELEEAVTYAHSRDIRVYVTINTLIHDRELADVGDYLIRLYSIGVDAVLVQDIGVAALAREIVPSLPLHASTQMTIHSTGGVRWAAEQGFSRVVLARELTLEEIARIARETADSGIGLEVFAHGALCYCYSGQCLLSSVIGGRSGNRGMCAQPCRKPYTLMTGDTDDYGRPTDLHELPSPGPYLLSPKDLCTFENLQQLVNSPVISLKIEGRMKSPEYVSMVVSTYRKALDAIAAGKEYRTPEALQDLRLAFNRGFSSGYLFGNPPAAIMGRDASDHRGICIGHVSRYDPKSKTVTVRMNGSGIPAPGDGLLFTDPKNPGSAYGFSLNTTPVQKDGEIALKVPHPVEPGTGVFITSSLDLDRRARQISSHPSPGLVRPVPMDLDVSVETGGNLVFEGLIQTRRGRAIPLLYRSDICLVPARSHPLTREHLEQQLKKTGNTPFIIRNFTLEYTGDMFTPLAGLNRVRREFLARVEEAMVTSSHPPRNSLEQALQRWAEVKPGLIARTEKTGIAASATSLVLGVITDSLLSVKKAVESGCDVICFEPVFALKDCRCRNPAGFTPYESQVMTASGLCRDAGIRFILKFPRITSDRYLDSVLPLVSRTLRPYITGVMVENCGTAHALGQSLPDQIFSGSGGLNIFNHEAARHLSSRFGMVTLSPELSRDEIRLLITAARLQGSPVLFGIIVQGSSEAMVSEDCILQPSVRCNGKEGETAVAKFFGIVDTTGHVFPVRVDGECRSHIYNSSEICLVDHLPELMQIGINEVFIDTRGRTATYTGDMTRFYREAVQLVEKGAGTGDPGTEKLKDAIKRRAIGGITAGHFLRGLREA
jgi:putative protease